MKSRIWNGLPVTLFLAGLTVLSAGCGGSGDGAPSAGKGAVPTDAVAETGHNLDGWWCTEHGLPEEECSMCSTEFAEQLKAKGDWCKEHDRGKSQCFICNPNLEAKFAARYEAKFGKKPPKRTE